MESSEYERYNEIAIQKATRKKPPRVKPEKWRLVFKVGNTIREELISGAYSLCVWEKKKYPNNNRYKIIPA